MSEEIYLGCPVLSGRREAGGVRGIDEGMERWKGGCRGNLECFEEGILKN